MKLVAACYLLGFAIGLAAIWGVASWGRVRPA